MKKLVPLVAVLVVLAAGFGLAMLADRPGGRPASPSSPSEAGTASAPVPSPLEPTHVPGRVPAPVAPAVLPATGDADVYAAAIAVVVFGMDTRDHAPGDYRDLLLAEADPTLSASGLADLQRLLADRIPTTEQWGRMRANRQWSAFEPTDVWEPGSWTQVVIAGDAEPGWVVRNVTGVQTTTYTTDTGADQAVRERTLTVAMRCPDGGVCRLLLVGASVLP